MKIAVLSDTHNQHERVRRALALLRERGVTTVLHCGDIEDVEMVRLFHGLDAHFVFGNCDADRDELCSAMNEAGVTLHEGFGNLEMEGVKIAFVHGDDGRLLRDLERSGHYDYLFHGHTHHAGERRTGATRIINPGALHRARPKTLLLLDLPTGQAEYVEVE
jgi:putative phosphoesterase